MTLPRPSLCPMIPSLLIAALLAGCTGLPKVAPAYAVHDFGGPDPVAARSPGVPLRGLEVVAAPWLASESPICFATWPLQLPDICQTG